MHNDERANGRHGENADCVAGSSFRYCADARRWGRARGRTELHLVPWNGGKRFCDGAAIGRTATTIHHESAAGLSQARQRCTFFETVHVERRREPEPLDGARSGKLFFGDTAFGRQ